MKIRKAYHPEMQSEKNRCLNWWKNYSQLDVYVSCQVGRWMPFGRVGSNVHPPTLHDAMSISYSNFRQMRRISRMVRCLVELQRLAYQTQDERNSKDALRFHLSALVFATLYTEIFKQPKKKSPRAMFGAPYHSIVCHMPKLYRIVSLRSIVTETSERIFHELKWVQALRLRSPPNYPKCKQ